MYERGQAFYCYVVNNCYPTIATRKPLLPYNCYPHTIATLTLCTDTPKNFYPRLLNSHKCYPQHIATLSKLLLSHYCYPLIVIRTPLLPSHYGLIPQKISTPTYTFAKLSQMLPSQFFYTLT